jgi:hypothetical protein
MISSAARVAPLLLIGDDVGSHPSCSTSASARLSRSSESLSLDSAQSRMTAVYSSVAAQGLPRAHEIRTNAPTEGTPSPLTMNSR